MITVGLWTLLAIRTCITIPLIRLSGKMLSGTMRLNMVVEGWYVSLNERNR